jgi:hypothetical protein
VRLIKTFALAAIAVGAFTAFLGATSASATGTLLNVVLCKKLVSPCPLADVVPNGAELHGTAKNPELLGSTTNVKCAESHVLGKIESATNLAHGKITKLEWLTCSQTDGQKCTVATNNLPYLIQGELKSDDKGYEALVTSSGVGRPSALVECPATGDCSFGANTVLFEALHTGTNGNTTVLDVLQTLTGEGFCFFTSGVWHAKYETTCLLPAGTNVPCWLQME